MKNGYPKWADRFLKWYCRPELLEEIQGDLYELFDQRINKQGPKSAKCRFVWDVIRSFRLSTIKNIDPNLSTMLLKSHLKLSYRQLWKQKYYTIINITGLAIGFVCCFFIGFYIQHELSFDKHHAQADHLYRLLDESYEQGRVSQSVYQSPPLAGALMENMVEVENVFRVRTGNARLVKTGPNEKNNFEELFLFADPSILELFHMPLKYGEASSALLYPFSVIISEEKANKYFGDEDPIGKQLYFDNKQERAYTITGVLQDIPNPSHLQYDFYISMESLEESKTGRWTISSYITYLLLRPGTDLRTTETKIFDLVATHKKELLKERITAENPDGYRYHLQAVKDIYLKSSGVMAFGHWPSGDPRYVWLFASIACLILFLAVINFINLSTARSANRAKEVGMRKVLGSRQTQLIGQFLFESILQSVFAFVLALGLVKLLYPFFEKLLPQSLIMPWDQWWPIPLLFGFSVLIGIFAGLYPAFFLSSFAPLRVLKSTVAGLTKSRLRSGLVICQFVTSVVLIFSTVLIYRQMDFIQNKKLGFEREQVLIVEDTYMLGEQVTAFKSSLEQMAAIKEVTASSFLPVDGYRINGSSFQHPDSAGGIQEVELRRWFVDENYLPTLGMKLLEGRNFSSEFSLDTNSIILNQSAVKLLGFENPIGKQLAMDATYEVIGVVEDFHFRSMKQDIAGLAFHRGKPQGASSTIIRTSTTDYEPLLTDIQKLWKTFAPDQVFRHHFLDEQFERMYAIERKTSSLFAIFTVLAIFIACLGVFALAAFTAEQRKKELSIRKVLGATTVTLFRLQTQVFIKLLFIALIIGIPVGYLAMQNWLNDFSYRVQISWHIFAISTSISFLLVLITIAYQAFKVATVNPINALKEE